MNQPLLKKILTWLLWISIPLFILCVLLPQGTGFTSIFRTRKVFYVSMTLLIAKGLLHVWKKEYGRFLEILPFLALFLYSCLVFSRVHEYVFGVDDAYYYSYVASVFIDKDLELYNQFEHADLIKWLHPKIVASKTAVGKSPNIFPVGLSVLWAPFFLIGYLIAAIAGLPLDGFSRPFVFSVAVGNICLVTAGVYSCYRFCSGFVSRLTALFATFALIWTTPHLHLYFRNFQILSEAPSFALAAFFFFIVWVRQNSFSHLRWFLIGLLLGILTMVRFHNFVFGIAPAILLLRYARTERNYKNFFQLIGVAAAGAFLGFLPQFVVWKIIYGQWIVSEAGSLFAWWKSPFVLETLFSSRKGLFPWAPITLLCVCGMFLWIKKDRTWAFIAFVIFAVTIWFNSSQLDWWSSTSLGSRRFVPLVSLFVVGLALLYTWANRIGRVLMVCLILALMFMDSYFVRSFRYGQLQYDHADRFSDILTGPYKPFQWIVYPLELPVQSVYTWKYGIPFYGPLNEFFIGEDVFYFQSKASNQMLSEESPFFGSGWQVKGGIRSTTTRDPVLYFPLFVREKSRIFIKFVFVPVEDENDIWMDFYCNGRFLRSKKVMRGGVPIEIGIRGRDYFNKVNVMKLHIYRSRSEEEAPQLILKKLEFSSRDEKEDETLTEENGYH